MNTTTNAGSVRSRLIEMASQLPVEESGEGANGLESLLGQLLDIVAERQDLRERVATLQARCEQLEAERDQFHNERNHLLHAWADANLSEEELDRRSKEPGGSSLGELWARLGRA
jgi:uncharacterized protein (DUF3084 family)